MVVVVAVAQVVVGPADFAAVLAAFVAAEVWSSTQAGLVAVAVAVAVVGGLIVALLQELRCHCPAVGGIPAACTLCLGAEEPSVRQRSDCRVCAVPEARQSGACSLPGRQR